ncbi:hypothetical protein D6833_02205, partial [Candidatus Parcubacteria bacterium]
MLASKSYGAMGYPEFNRNINLKGQVLSEADANGYITNFTYDSVNHRLLTVEPPTGDPSHADYAPDGSWIRYWTGSSFDASSNAVTVYFDAFGRRCRRAERVHSDFASNLALVSFERYDLDGRKEFETLPRVLDENADLSQVSEAYKIYHTYDMQGRETERRDTLGSTVTVFDGHSDGVHYYAQVTDKDGRVSTSYSDALGQQVGFDYGAVKSFSNVRWQYLRDRKNGNLLQIDFTPDDGLSSAQSRHFTYDGLNRKIGETHPETGTHTYTYDANGNITDHIFP